MKWFIDDPRRGQLTLTAIILLVVVVGIWLGRKRPIVTIPIALVFLLLAGIAIPSAIPARPAAQRNACIFNLRAIQDAKIDWSREKNKESTDVPSPADLYATEHTSGFLRGPLSCPRGGTYTIGSVGQDPTCTFSNLGHRLN